MSRVERSNPNSREELEACLKDLEVELATVAPGPRMERIRDDIARLRSYAVLKGFN